MSEMTDVIDNLTAELERIRAENLWLRDSAIAACNRALACVGTYGRRDEGGLTGLSAVHWREIASLEKGIRERTGFQGFLAESKGPGVAVTVTTEQSK
jgi:hypothetical protein